ncbi:hypothetical protein MYCTH_2309023 [Thermothelomyces thermophilus ATCC 42464]|uniref:F-box domain-containing protein n=1 Tax=Thermothelomyces thermophilus (strain ATCC 42464 / BCRC 31852 / DSM 1799) TaxID=573729 RepID=G2QHU8_THET4|nr:uncharacterized protein MYCTH_2309023 [Thermothelomyces thermophilus ATCC 42464]AEO60137.1 hypothetical protein MYCTH_2309023 [Thermothelomyces thermophilus ATCC 42464]
MDSLCATTSIDDGGSIHAESLTIDTHVTRAARTQSIHQEDDGHATVELVSIMATASNPVSPGSPTPPLAQARRQDFIPPTRPSSTPFPQPEPRSTELRCVSRPTSQVLDPDAPDPADAPKLPLVGTNVDTSLNDLPTEIHECILDHLFGFRVSAGSKSSITRWGTALRHPRRRELSELSLVSREWRILIQERLYRHIKLKASLESLKSAMAYFAAHPHLRPYVKHIEIWFPVFHPKYRPLALSNANTLPTVTPDGLTTASYVLPMDNCSLEEVFYFVAESLPEVCILTLEGGERKKAPKVRHWIRDASQHRVRAMPKVHSVRTLICKGQWNLIRGEEDFETIMSALPNLQEWHGSYSKPKSKSYLTMADILVKPMRLSSLDLCIEGDYRRELSFPPYFLKVSNRLHFCSRLAAGAASPFLEHISYTGRVCKQFFIDLMAKHKDPRNSRLKSIDLTVKNCCRQVAHWNESGSGITDMNFINAFEELVIAGIRALGRLKSVEYLRIRYVDLDTPYPPLNPHFILRNGRCSGVWSDSIISEMNRARPNARFEELSESFGEVGYQKDGRMTFIPEFPASRPISLKLSNYALLDAAMSIS